MGLPKTELLVPVTLAKRNEPFQNDRVDENAGHTAAPLT